VTDREDDPLVDEASRGGDEPSTESRPEPTSEPNAVEPAPLPTHEDDRPTEKAADDVPQYGVGPFSVREVALLGVWFVAFVVSFFQTNLLDSPSRVLAGGANVWLSGLWWIPAVALPTVAVGLVVLRRLSPQGIRRVGSLGIDQFASVAFSFAALVWISWVWDTVAIASAVGVWTRSWVIWVEAVLMVAGVVLTVFAPIVPPFEQDFQGRDEVPAHRNARPIRAVVTRPRAPRPPRPTSAAPAAEAVAPSPEQAPATAAFPAADHHDTDVLSALHGDTGVHDTGAHTAGSHEAGHAGTSSSAQAFWALTPVERDVVDDYGTPIFRVGPTAWALVIEDRGETFVVRHDDGRIGYLHDVSGVTRG